MALVKLTKNGFQRATFNETVQYITNWYKRVYGTDIDTAAGTADGDFIQQLALMATDITSAQENIFANLDIDSAQGRMLDVLCALGNVFRRPASYSYASITIENAGTSTFTSTGHLDFLDATGSVWRYTGNINLAAGAEQTITVYCRQIGPIEAPAGSINKTMLITQLNVSQPSAATLGSNVESDDSLRERKQSANNAFGVTTLDSVISALRNISGVEDVRIYNNTTSSAITAADGTTIPTHNIYVVVRKNDNVDIDQQIGSTIYNKLTPGISTTEYTPEQQNPTGTSKSYQYISSSYGVTSPNLYVYWKEAIPVHNGITVSCTISPNNLTNQAVANAMQNVIKWLNSRPIGTTLRRTEICAQIEKYAPKQNGKNVIFANTVTFVNANVNDTYCDYSTVQVNLSAATNQIVFG